MDDLRHFMSHLNVFVHWFILAYLSLYLLAPIFNAFIDDANKKLALQIVLTLFLLDIVREWCIKDYRRGVFYSQSLFVYIGVITFLFYYSLRFRCLLIKYENVYGICFNLSFLNDNLNFNKWKSPTVEKNQL